MPLRENLIHTPVSRREGELSKDPGHPCKTIAK